MSMAVQRARQPRWLWPLVVGLSLVTVCAVPAGAVAVWFVQGTVAAGEGGETPVLAAYGVVSGLGALQDEDLARTWRYLSGAYEYELRARLVEYRRRLVADDPTVHVVTQNLVADVRGRQADVTGEVGLQWSVRAGSSVGFQTSTPLPWRFHTVQGTGLSKGWTVDAFTAPDICAYIRC